MNAEKRFQIQQSLRRLAESHAALMAFLEQALAVICTELQLEHITARGTLAPVSPMVGDPLQPVADHNRLSVLYRGRACFLGNTLPFKLFDRLAQSRNHYVSTEVLLADVWQGARSDEAVRSVVKELRRKLRSAQMGDLADAIDGNVAGHYALVLG